MQRIILIYYALYAFNLNAANLSDIFPSIKNWKVDIDKNTYDIGNLWGILGEKAEMYDKCGFQELRIAAYSNKAGSIIKAELYKFKNSSGAYGVYISERNPDYAVQNVGVEGLFLEDILIFITGDYFVKLSSQGMQPADKNDLIDIGNQISGYISIENKWPEPVELFPQDLRIMNSDRYIPQDFLGYNFLHSAFTVSYNQKNPFILFIINPEDKDEAVAMLEKYTGVFKEEKVTKEGEYYFVSDFFNGNVIMSLQSNYLIGAAGYVDKEEALRMLNMICEKIKHKTTE